MAVSAWALAWRMVRRMSAWGSHPGKPLGDIRGFVEKFRAQEGLGTLPPIIVAALRRKMVALAGEIAQGVVFANASRSHMATSLAALPAGRRDDPDFFIGNMIPTCISDDVEAAKAVNRRTLTSYAFLPNYRNYWREAGYQDEMDLIETAIADGRSDDVPNYFSDRWLSDKHAVRDGHPGTGWCRSLARHRCARSDHRAVIRRGQSVAGFARGVRRFFMMFASRQLGDPEGGIGNECVGTPIKLPGQTKAQGLFNTAIDSDFPRTS